MITTPMIPLHPVIDVAGTPFRATTLASAAAWMVDTAVDPDAPAVAVRLANAYCVALASQQPEYQRVLAGDGVTFPDGAPVVAAMNLLRAKGEPGARRVRGPSFFREVLERGVDRGVRHFFLGSTPETLAALESAVRKSYPGVMVVGSYSPPFAAVDEAYLADLVERASTWAADIVWVGMGTPKQDFIATALAQGAGVHAAGVGAAFDFAAGTVREAPAWVQRSGLEWAYRFATEPRRLWQRYVFGNSRFIALVVRQLVRRGR